MRVTESDVRKGVRFGSWVVLSGPYRGKESRAYYECQCDCGLVKKVEAKSLVRCTSSSCIKCAWKRSPRYHGASRSNASLYRLWREMKSRCNNSHREKYPVYGGRGIYVCSEWEESYVAFSSWAKLQRGHDDPLLQIDRKDNNGPYSPDNCWFVTGKVNCRNKQYNRKLSAFGETKCLTAWEEDPRCRVSRGAIKYRLGAGWNPEKAIATDNMRA